MALRSGLGVKRVDQATGNIARISGLTWFRNLVASRLCHCIHDKCMSENDYQFPNELHSYKVLIHIQLYSFRGDTDRDKKSYDEDGGCTENDDKVRVQRRKK